jgi:predicted AAA+ superfamily ATPase
MMVLLSNRFGINMGFDRTNIKRYVAIWVNVKTFN